MNHPTGYKNRLHTTRKLDTIAIWTLNPDIITNWRRQQLKTTAIRNLQQQNGYKNQLVTTANRTQQCNIVWLQHVALNPSDVKPVPGPLAPRQFAPGQLVPRQLAPRHLAPRKFRPTDISPHRHFAPRTFRPTDISPHGHFAPRTFRPTENSPHGQLATCYVCTLSKKILKTCTHILAYSFPWLVEACALSETVYKELKSPQHFNP